MKQYGNGLRTGFIDNSFGKNRSVSQSIDAAILADTEGEAILANKPLQPVSRLLRFGPQC